jgi:elongation factor G
VTVPVIHPADLQTEAAGGQDAVVIWCTRPCCASAASRASRSSVEPCPDRALGALSELREALLLAAAEADETLADRVLAGEEPDAAE